MERILPRFMPSSCIRISDAVVFGIPRSTSTSHTFAPIFVDCSLYTFNILRCSACFSPSSTWTTFNRFSTIFEASVPHFYLCCTHCIVHENLLNHPNSFRGGMFKLNAKSDVDLLLYSLSHFECDGHTVQMLTQWRLLPHCLVQWSHHCSRMCEESGLECTCMNNDKNI